MCSAGLPGRYVFRLLRGFCLLWIDGSGALCSVAHSREDTQRFGAPGQLIYVLLLAFVSWICVGSALRAKAAWTKAERAAACAEAAGARAEAAQARVELALALAVGRAELAAERAEAAAHMAALAQARILNDNVPSTRS